MLATELAYEDAGTPRPTPERGSGQAATPASRAAARPGRSPAPGPGNVRECVERPVRQRAADPGNRVQPGDDHVAPPPELRQHGGHPVLRPLQRGDGRVLAERRGAGDRVDRQPRHRLHERRREHAEAQPPARHRVRLRPAVEQHRPRFHAVELKHRRVRPAYRSAQ